MLDPIPAVILHATIVALTAVALSARLKHAHTAVALGMIVGIAASLFWKGLGLSFWAAWRYGLCDPESAKGFLAFWLLPAALAYGATWIRAKSV